MSASDTQKKYWNSYYSTNSTKASTPEKLIPSQFAAFVLSEFSDRNRFIDLGCGNGRDSFFFADHGKQVMGVDGSSVAVDLSNTKARDGGYENIGFEKLDFSKATDCADFSAKHKDRWNGAIAYARFFLHAISDQSEDNFIDVCHGIIGDKGKVCLEFRTDKDEFLAKVTDTHFRRFINPVDLIRKFHQKGMNVAYFAEGFGFAKYKDDNAYVARMIVEKQ